MVSPRSFFSSCCMCPPECPGPAPAAVAVPAMIVILGGGPAGRLASIRLASAGKQVILVERGGIGGQCLHSGCMPVCALNDVARLIHAARELRDIGVVDTVPAPDFPVLLKKMKEISRRSPRPRQGDPISRCGYHLCAGRAGLQGEWPGPATSGLKAEAVIAATRPAVRYLNPRGINLPGVFTSKTLPGMRKFPEKLVIIGGSMIMRSLPTFSGTSGAM